MSRFPKVGARVVEFGAYAGFFTLASLGYSRMYGQSEEAKHEELQKKYPELVAQSRGNKQAMQDFFNTMKKDTNDPGNQKKFDDLLQAGKGKKNKRQGANVGIEDTIKPVAKPAVLPLKEKKPKKADEKKKGWLW
jgi:hypothetical protein